MVFNQFKRLFCVFLGFGVTTTFKTHELGDFWLHSLVLRPQPPGLKAQIGVAYKIILVVHMMMWK